MIISATGVIELPTAISKNRCCLAYLSGRGYTSVQINRVLDRLRTEALNPNRSLYDNNKEVYSLLRYGVQVQASVGEQTRDGTSHRLEQRDQ
jgi:type I site-specific restriction-modification system R (restriction) subunit